MAARSRSIEIKLDDSGAMNDPLVRAAESEEDKRMWLHAIYGEEADLYDQVVGTDSLLTSVIGKDVWTPLLDDNSLRAEERCWRLVEEYEKTLRNWFRVVVSFPIRPDTGSSLPKYWMCFGTRYSGAIDLFNRACCMASRWQRRTSCQPDTLFAGMQLKAPVVPDGAASPDRMVRLAVARFPMSWEELRWWICSERRIGDMTDSEIDAGIKRTLRGGLLVGATGSKVRAEVRSSASLDQTQ